MVYLFFIISFIYVRFDIGDRKGRLSDLFQEKVSLGKDFVMESFLEFIKDWFGYGDYRE